MASSVTSQFEGKSFYEILEIPKDATTSTIRKAYRILAFKYHPDKNPGNDQATADFQWLTKAVEILADESKRAAYDRTGSADDVSEDFQSAYEYWRERYAAVTEVDIKEYEKTYKGSAQEQEDLFDAYTRFQGNMHKVMEWVILSGPDDVDRFEQLIQTAIASKKIKRHAAFKRTLKELTFITDEEDEAMEAKRELGLTLDGTEESLRQAIISRKKKGDFLADLEARYGGGSTKPKAAASAGPRRQPKSRKVAGGVRAGAKGTSTEIDGDEDMTKGTKRTRQRKSKAKQHDDISDQDFEKLQAAMLARRNK